MRHEQADGPFGPSMPLSEVGLAQAQQAVLEHIRQAIQSLDEHAKRVAYVRGVVLDLDLMHDYDGIVHTVREKAARILEHLQDEAMQTAASQKGGAPADDQSADDPWDQTGSEQSPVPAVGTATTWQHLARAVAILTCYPDLQSKKDFEEKALLLQERLGPPGGDPGSTIWRGVQRLGKKHLDTTQLPAAYQYFPGFQRLVFDLLHDNFIIQDNCRTRKPLQDNLQDKI
jgi:hypothetical protein